MDEKTLYVEQMKHWFAEQQMIDEQLERAGIHYQQLAELNKEQLMLHKRRIELAKQEYNNWAAENGVTEHTEQGRGHEFPGAFYLVDRWAAFREQSPLNEIPKKVV